MLCFTLLGQWRSAGCFLSPPQFLPLTRFLSAASPFTGLWRRSRSRVASQVGVRRARPARVVDQVAGDRRRGA